MKIAYLNVNRFNPFLCDGVSASSLELMQFLKAQGHEVVILTYCTNEPYKQNVFNRAVRQFAPELKFKVLRSFSFIVDKIQIYQELLPFNQIELPDNKEYLLQLMIRKITETGISHLITVDDDFPSLLPGSLLGIPCCHFFHSPAYLSSYKESSFFSNVLKKRKLFAVSGFLQAKIKKELRLDAELWHPLFDLGKYRLKKNWNKINSAGYYSAGRHKGDNIVNRLVLDIPDWTFTVIGQHYTHGFEKIPKNLKLRGDNPDFQEFYDSIGLLLVPSLIEEGFPRVILEAAVNGIPTVANSLGGIPEALGGSGILVELSTAELRHPDLIKLVSVYRESIQRIDDDSSFYQKLQQGAFDRAGAYESKQTELSMKNLKKMFAG